MEKFTSGKYDQLITPMDEEGNRTKNDPDTANAPTTIDPPDPMGLLHGLGSGNRLAKDGKPKREK